MKKVLSLVLLGVLLVGCANTSTEKPKETMNGEQPQQQVEQPKEEKKAPFSAEDLKRDEKWNVTRDGKSFKEITWDGKDKAARPRIYLGDGFNLTGEYKTQVEELSKYVVQVREGKLYVITDNKVVFESKVSVENKDGRGVLAYLTEIEKNEINLKVDMGNSISVGFIDADNKVLNILLEIDGKTALYKSPLTK